MRSEASLARLAEMGIDVYVPRAAYRGWRPQQHGAAAMATRPSIVLVAAAASASEARLLADIERALTIAGLDVLPRACAAEPADAKRARAADARIIFAADDESKASAVAPSPVSSRDPLPLPPLATLHANADGKRRLWRELRSLVDCLHGAAAAESHGVGEPRASH